MDIYTFYINISGLISGLLVSIIGFIFSYLTIKENKRGAYRQRLYEKQFNMSITIINLASKLIGKILQIYGENKSDIRQKYIKEAFELNHTISEQCAQSQILFPKEIYNKLNDFGIVANDEIEYLKETGKCIVHEQEWYIVAEEVQSSFFTLINSLRKLIGTDSLNIETLKLFNKVNNRNFFR